MTINKLKKSRQKSWYKSLGTLVITHGENENKTDRHTSNMVIISTPSVFEF